MTAPESIMCVADQQLSGPSITELCRGETTATAMGTMLVFMAFIAIFSIST